MIDKDDLEAALGSYSERLNLHFSRLMRAKLGLATQQEGDGELFADFFALLANNHTDYTRFLRELSCLDRQGNEAVIDLVLDREAAKTWLTRYLERAARELGQEGRPISIRERCQAMRQVNPKYILRNYLAQQAIEFAERGDFEEMQRLALCWLALMPSIPSLNVTQSYRQNGGKNWRSVVLPKAGYVWVESDPLLKLDGWISTHFLWQKPRTQERNAITGFTSY